MIDTDAIRKTVTVITEGPYPFRGIGKADLDLLFETVDAQAEEIAEDDKALRILRTINAESAEDVDAQAEEIKQLTHQLEQWVEVGTDLTKKVDARAEEIKRLEIEVANWRYWRGTATKANDNCEAENKRLEAEIKDLQEKTERFERVLQERIEYGYPKWARTETELFRYVLYREDADGNRPLKPDTEEGET